MSHYLVVIKYWDEDHNCWGFDHFIEHADDCPTEVRYFNDFDGNHYHSYTCGVGYWEDNYGFMDLADDPRFNTEGKYKIDFYNYTPQSYFEDAEAYLYFVENDAQDS